MLRKIFNIEAEANTSEASSEQEAGPLAGVARGSAPLPKKILYFLSYICIISGPF